MTELGKVGKSRKREDAISSEENEEEDEIGEQSLRVSYNCGMESSSLSPKAGSIVTVSKGGLPGEEMV